MTLSVTVGREEFGVAKNPEAVRCGVAIRARNGRRARRATLLGVCWALSRLAAEPNPPDAAAALDPATNVAQMSFEELLEVNVDKVYSASKYEQSVRLAPASVSIITSDEIHKLGFQTLASALNSVGGFYTTYDRSYSYLGIRGFNRPGDYSTRVLLMVDGHRINDPIYSAAQIGTDFPIDMDQIERVEVIRGPSSSLYGDNAFFGVVNVITRKGQQVDGVELSGEYGSYDTYKGVVTLGKRWKNGLDLLVSGSYYDSAGPGTLYYPEFDDPATRNGITQGTDGDRYWHGLVNELSGLQLRGRVQLSRERHPDGPVGQPLR